MVQVRCETASSRMFSVLSAASADTAAGSSSRALAFAASGAVSFLVRHVDVHAGLVQREGRKLAADRVRGMRELRAASSRRAAARACRRRRD
jgi:hypothetical protein